MDEKFFFHYHMRMSQQDYMTMPVHERKWLVQRFLEQKRKEQEAIDRMKKQNK